MSKESELIRCSKYTTCSNPNDCDHFSPHSKNWKCSEGTCEEFPKLKRIPCYTVNKIRLKERKIKLKKLKKLSQ